jgi:hypothetical protein
MSDFTLTTASVHYEHKCPGPADYESKAPWATLNFAFAEDVQDPVAVIDTVMAMAVNAVNKAIGLAPVKQEPVGPIVEKPAKIKGKIVSQPEPAPMTPNAAAIVDEVVIISGVDVEPEQATQTVHGEDDDDALLGLPAKKPISDEDLQAMSMDLRAYLVPKFGNINKLKSLINQVLGVESGGMLLQIPPAKRGLFMDMAKGLKASE